MRKRSHGPVIVAACLVLAGLGGIAFDRPVLAQEAAPAPATSPTTPPSARAVEDCVRDHAGTIWYGIYLQGNKVGHARISVSIEAGDVPFVRAEDDVEISLRALGQDVDLKIHSVSDTDLRPPYLLRRTSKVQTQNESEEKLRIDRTDEGYVATVTQAGQTRTQDLGALDYSLLDALALPLWLREERPVGAVLEHRGFDDDTLSVKTGKTEVKAVRRLVRGGVPVRVYDIVSTDHEGSRTTAVVDGLGRTLSFEIGGTFSARLEPEEVARKRDATVDFFFDNTVRVDRKLGEAPRVTRLTIALDAERGALFGGAPGQTITRRDDGTFLLALDPAGGPRVKAEAAEIASALEATLEFPAEHEKLKTLARGAIGDATTRAAQVRRLVLFVSAYVRDDNLAAGGTVLDVVAERKGDCTEHTDLLTTLCRALGIPCRSVGGLMYMGDDAGSFGGHAWNEVVLDGHWVPVDATWNQMTIDATHLRFPLVQSQDLTLRNALRGITLEVVTVEHAK